MKTRQVFWPPRPKAFDITAPILSLARCVGHVVQVALRVGELLVDRRRDDLVADGQGADNGLDRAGSRGEVAGHRLGGANGDAVSALAEDLLDGGRLGLVVEGCRSAVGVDVVEVVDGQAGVLEAARHRQRLAVDVGSRVVSGVEGPGGAGELADDRRTAVAGVLFRLEHQDARRPRRGRSPSAWRRRVARRAAARRSSSWSGRRGRRASR